MSRVANNPINVPDTVNVSMSPNRVLIKGNKGELDSCWDLPYQ
jgi:Ribosomal protein L6P/L9E